MGKSKSPKPADPKETAGAQTSTNIGTAIAQQYLNNVNQVTPFGSLTFEQTGNHEYLDPLNNRRYDIPTFTARQTLHPTQQETVSQNLNAEKNLATLAAEQSGRLAGLLNRPMETESLPEGGDANNIRQTQLSRMTQTPTLIEQIGDAGEITKTYGTDFGDERNRVEEALLERLDPSIQKDRERLEVRLADMGIMLGTEAYNDAVDELNRQKTDARLAAIISAGQEHSRLAELEADRAGFQNAAQAQAYGQNHANAEFTNNARQQSHLNQAQNVNQNNQATLNEVNADIAQFNAQNIDRDSALKEQFAIRNQPLNEITALLSGSQIRDPQFINPNSVQIDPVNFAGIQADYDATRQNQHRASVGAFNSGLEALLGLAGKII